MADIKAGGTGPGGEAIVTAQEGVKPESGRQDAASVALDFEGWMGGQPEEIKGLVDGHVKGLKNALMQERENRRELEKQLRQLAKDAEAGSAAQKSIAEMADKVSRADRKALFFEEGHGQGVGNLKVAFVLAESEGLFGKNGEVDWAELKKMVPELFGQQQTQRVAGNAGSGTGAVGGVKADGMDSFIRRKAGVG